MIMVEDGTVLSRGNKRLQSQEIVGLERCCGMATLKSHHQRRITSLLFFHKSPVKNCALPIPKLQSSLVFAEQVIIRSVPGTPQSFSTSSATLHTTPASILHLVLAEILG